MPRHSLWRLTATNKLRLPALLCLPWTVTLMISRPKRHSGEIPCVIFYHGGGMTILSSVNEVFNRWHEDLASAGMIAIGVDFRNAFTRTDRNPFPTGLNVCFAALQWVHANRAELGISKIVLNGDSGAANLALATALKANREGVVSMIDGVYAIAPTISGAYAWDTHRKSRELPSLVEFDGYTISTEELALLCTPYDPTRENAENPLCWRYWATPSDLRGLPPHVITVDELDPMRDEGITYFRKLQVPGVHSVGRVNLGLVHIAEVPHRQTVADDRFATIDQLHEFAARL